MKDYKQMHIDREGVFCLKPPTRRLREKLVFQLITSQGKGQVSLDAGCGAGSFTREMLKRNFKVDAFDPSSYAIGRLKETISPTPRLRAWTSDVENFQSKEKYDLILISDVLEHIKDDRKAIMKIWSFLKVNGQMIVTVPFDQKLWSKCDEASGHFRRYSKQSLKEMLDLPNLEILKFWCYGFPLLRLVAWIRKIFPVQDKEIGEKTKNPLSLLGFFIRMFVWIVNALLFFDSHLLSTSKGVALITLVRKVK